MALTVTKSHYPYPCGGAVQAVDGVLVVGRKCHQRIGFGLRDEVVQVKHPRRVALCVMGRMLVGWVSEWMGGCLVGWLCWVGG